MWKFGMSVGVGYSPVKIRGVCVGKVWSGVG